MIQDAMAESIKLRPRFLDINDFSAEADETFWWIELEKDGQILRYDSIGFEVEV